MSATPATAGRPGITHVTRFVVVAALAAACAAPAPTPASGVAADVAYLASRELAGRGAGSRGGDSAAAYIVREYQRLGIPGPYYGYCDTGTSCAAAYLQHLDLGGDIAQNVIGVIVGSDSVLRREFVVVGAHYDHLGESPMYSLDPQLGWTIRAGADDNASGSAAVLELARRFAARPTRHSLLLVHFDAEEMGLIGSRAFVKSPPVPRAAMTMMLNRDMVGRRRARPIRVQAGAATRELRALVDSAATLARVKTIVTMDAGRSDHASDA